MAGTKYPHSGRVNCGPSDNDVYTDWDVAGHGKFTTVLGIDDAAENAGNAKATITIADQDRQPLQPGVVVSIGHVRRVSLNVENVTRLHIVCVSEDNDNRNADRFFLIAFGSALLSG